MKKIIKNLILALTIIFSIIELVFIGKLYHEISTSPQLFIYITEPFPSYYIQDKVVEGWENYCIVGLVFLSLIALISLISLICMNLLPLNKNEDQKLKRKNRKIEKLQAELEELKKD
ncbi:MAG: hypothetical protein K2L42_06640 [Clostridia bacterium]|nr:hypothetical protein [Clostridia bacterium]